jgi:hypothetical protein
MAASSTVGLDSAERATLPTILGLLRGLDNAERAVLLEELASLTFQPLGPVALLPVQVALLPVGELLGRWRWLTRRMLISNEVHCVNRWSNDGPELATLRAKEVLDEVTRLITNATEDTINPHSPHVSSSRHKPCNLSGKSMLRPTAWPRACTTWLVAGGQ